jgi:O-methyltransferase
MSRLGRRIAHSLSKLARETTHRFGLDLVPYQRVPADLSPADRELVEFVRPYTMTSPERIFGLTNATRFLVAEGIKGDVVECGVWRGGSMMAVARTLLYLDAADRDLHLFDTYTGMTAPTAEDRDLHGRPAAQRFAERTDGEQTSDWCRAGIETVRDNLARTGYPAHRLHFVAGMVEQTIPAQAPSRIALLRLDTDWYVSTRHELEHLWPRLVSGGICIIDDYGHWRGSRQAVDEYFAEHRLNLLLHRLDYSGRLVVKP